MKDLLRSGYWPASITNSTLYTLDLLSSFKELKIISPGFSRQAFAKLLEHRTKCGGRVSVNVIFYLKKKKIHKQTISKYYFILYIFQSGPINGDALQRSFLELSYTSFEEDQLCCSAPLTCPACTPEMLAVSADGNRKLYRFRRNGRWSFFQSFYLFIFLLHILDEWIFYFSFFLSSDDPGFFEGVFVAEDSAVSTFVDTIQKAVKNASWQNSCYNNKRNPHFNYSGLPITKSNWENECHILNDSIAFIWFVMFVLCVIDTRKRHMWGLPLDSSEGNFQEGFKIGWRGDGGCCVSPWVPFESP